MVFVIGIDVVCEAEKSRLEESGIVMEKFC
jgi:hypothetical protein